MKIIPRRNNSLLSLFDEDLFDDIFNSPFSVAERKSSVMKTDIKEDEKSYTLEMDLPGIKKEDLKITYEEGYLTVEAKNEYSNEESNKGKYIRRERYIGSYARSFYMGEIEDDSISASYNDGILSINIPKKQIKQVETKKYIEIK